ncbi:MAG: ABC transporter ATP-binding protein [Rhizobiaceae bacterium]|nr:ABC transporter ATP-binding protein [Rhizobiaceae bacterium]
MTDKDMKDGRDGAHSFALKLNGISKSFGAVRANRDISLDVRAGSIHGIVGENGAGKSTLMNIIFGLQTADSGDMQVFGQLASIRSSADAIGLGVGMVHQHFMLVPNMSVLDNVMLGTEGGYLLAEGREQTLEKLKQLSSEYGMGVDPFALIEDLPVGIRQRVEIIKAIKGGARILILDEPTGVLTPGEAKQLFDILRSLRDDGVTVLLITHKLEEIMAITDHVSIMRDGEMVAHRETAATNPQELARLMVGRDVLLSVEKEPASPREVKLRVSGLGCSSRAGNRLLKDVSFELRAGEILGIAGVAGNGQTELLEILSGMRTVDDGSIKLLDQTIDADNALSPYNLRELGVAHIPEDRHEHGLVLSFEAQENAILGYHNDPGYVRGMVMDKDAVLERCETLMKDHDVRPPNPSLHASNFSGGNQQKIVIGREVDRNPEILLVGQPTRGVDVGAIEFIHKQLIRLRDEGCAILLVSVELEEILSLSDRVMVMNEGEIVGIVDQTEASQERVGMMMAGIGSDAAA